MRFSLSSQFGKSTSKVLVAAFLASAATGCSSDATRFGGLFSNSDQITTNSIPRRSLNGLDGDPVPRADLAQGGGGYQQQQDYSSRNAALNQGYPAAPQTYKPAYSSARVASAPVVVQRSELAAPSESGPAPVRAPAASRAEREAMAQPFPASRKEAAHRAGAPSLAPDTMSTGTVPKAAAQSSSGWTAVNAPSVTLGTGETIATLSRRYGVPEKEILKANDLRTATSAMPGQRIVIPTMNGGAAANPAKTASQAVDLSKGGKMPAPAKAPEQDAAVLPGNGAQRDKWQAGPSGAAGKPGAGAGKGPAPEGGMYVVKPGDSIAKIARDTGVHVDELKAANNIDKGGIRIGQTLKIPHGGTLPADQIKTASITPQKPAVQKPAAKATPVAAAPATANPQPTAVKADPGPAPVATQTVGDAEKKSDVATEAPEATGIGKYRWPVRGAVVAAYGANVDGNRNDGIDISVPEGTPVKAAENGVVIYAGNGLKELGNTVLVRHDDGTVTVYGHADQLSVSRGQKVQRGQTVATSGMSGNAKQPTLHFEVRKNASPVNPMTFLE
jgi:murein DD-endopeptidase MepM/ murein hydrolase activator NlpD